jgi:ketosteroid isomerase-like protein
MIQALGQPTLRLDTAEVEEIGDAACEIGAYTLTAGGETDKGKYVVIWKREGGDWKLAVDIWNTDTPLPS